MSKYVLYDKSIERIVASSDDRLIIHEEFWNQIDQHGAHREDLVVLIRKETRNGKI